MLPSPKVSPKLANTPAAANELTAAQDPGAAVAASAATTEAGAGAGAIPASPLAGVEIITAAEAVLPVGLLPNAAPTTTLGIANTMLLDLARSRASKLAAENGGVAAGAAALLQDNHVRAVQQRQQQVQQGLQQPETRVPVSSDAAAEPGAQSCDSNAGASDAKGSSQAAEPGAGAGPQNVDDEAAAGDNAGSQTEGSGSEAAEGGKLYEKDATYYKIQVSGMAILVACFSDEQIVAQSSLPSTSVLPEASVPLSMCTFYL